MLLSHLRKEWQRWTTAPCPAEIQVATITSCPFDHGNDIVLVFADRNRLPSYILKICRDNRFAFKLQREFAALRRFFGDREAGVPVPQPFHLGAIGSRTVIVQEAIPATSLAQRLTESGLTKANRDLLDEALELLIRINQRPASLQERPHPVLDPRLHLDGSDRATLEASAERLLEAQLTQYAHGDYWPLNLLTRQREIVGVIDWEFASSGAAIPTDIIWFLVNTSYLLCRHEQPAVSIAQAYGEVFFGDSIHTELMRDLYGRYSGAFGLDPDLFLPLLEVGIAEMAQRELLAYGAHGKMDRVCLQLLRHTLDHQKELQV